MTHRPNPHGLATTRRLVLVVASGALAALALTACGSSSSSNAAPQPVSAPSSSPGATRPGGPAASGTVAAVSGTTMQVQSQQNGQVAVSWSDSTKFSHTVTATMAAVKAGQCVTAVAPSGTSSSATSFTATTLVVSTPVSGQCNGGFGGAGAGAAGGERPTGVPSGRPSAMSSGGSRPSGGAGAFGTIASGKVLSVSGSKLVIAAQSFGSSNSTPTSKTVTANSGTRITTEASATSTAVRVGVCVSAQGTADATGTVAATSVRITQATNGVCSGGFGGPNGSR